jgi:hypothetical protein
VVAAVQGALALHGDVADVGRAREERVAVGGHDLVVNAAARRLHVHPQTIRYRLRQVSELFGEALYDPDDRFRLLLALRVRGLLGG